MKLTNILLSAQGVAKLVDFGLAGQDAASRSIDDEVDRAVEYATLERGSGAPDNDPRSDLFFLGTIYYELLTGKHPYPPTKSKDERRQFSRYRDIKPIREVDPSLPPGVVKVVDKLLLINASERYQTPADVVRDLRIALAELRPGAVDDSVVQVPPQKPSPTVLCVEERLKQQDSLREYFSKHGYRVLLLRDFERAMTRLRTDAPKGLVLMGDSLGENVEAFYGKAVLTCRQTGTAVVLVLSKSQLDLKNKLAGSDTSRVLFEQPVTLRSIRKALEDVWNKPN
jgi:serine/threonine protein kinase